MARAKRTTRAEARRRYRAEHGLPDDTTLDDEAQDEDAAASTTSRSARPTAGQPERISVFAALRLAIHPLDLRGDLRSLPSLARNKALLLPILLTLGSTAVFLGGFLAPRASWLVGVVIGLVSALCYVALGVSGLLPAPFAEQFTVNALGASVSAFIYSPIMGAFFAAAAAWYRRFLALSSPNRNRRASQAQKQRPGDGRTRGTSQKASAKR